LASQEQKQSHIPIKHSKSNNSSNLGALVHATMPNKLSKRSPSRKPKQPSQRFDGQVDRRVSQGSQEAGGDEQDCGDDDCPDADEDCIAELGVGVGVVGDY
jgi:hypothetical protein